MAYYSGTANSLTDLATAIVTHAVADGWTATPSSFTGSISTNVLTVSAVAAGHLNIGATITGAGVTPGTTITSVNTGRGGVGTYFVSPSQTVVSTTMSNGSTTLSKAGVHFSIAPGSLNLSCLGAATATMGSPAPDVVSIGRIFANGASNIAEITFPCTYHVFGFAQEFYVVVKYATEYFQWLAFGKSTVPGLINAGGWVGATIGRAVATNSNMGATQPIYMAHDRGGYGYSQFGSITYLSAAALFWHGGAHNYSNGTVNYYNLNSYVNHGLDGRGWASGESGTSGPPSQAPMSPLVALASPAWNSEPVLLPLRCYMERPSFKLSIVADLENARITRLGYMVPEEIISIGADQWMVFPWYRREPAAPAGSVSPSGANHTGTIGWAIKYEGP